MQLPVSLKFGRQRTVNAYWNKALGEYGAKYFFTNAAGHVNLQLRVQSSWDIIGDQSMHDCVKRSVLLTELKKYLKYSIDSVDRFEIEEPSQTPEDLSELLELCESVITPIINNVLQDAGCVNDEVLLNSELSKLRRKFHQQQFNEWCDLYANASDQFDNKRVFKLIEEWPKLLENLKKMAS